MQGMKSLGYFLSKATKHNRSFYLPSLGSNMEAMRLIVILVVANSEFRLLGQQMRDSSRTALLGGRATGAARADGDTALNSLSFFLWHNQCLSPTPPSCSY